MDSLQHTFEMAGVVFSPELPGAQVRSVHIPDVEADPDYRFAEAQRLGVFRTILAVPMLREGVPIGVIRLDEAYMREGRAFSGVSHF
jgi:signal transduction protein with GAF and PtsI domain